MRQTPATAALGCGGSMILLGSFVSGFYLGNANARGIPVDEHLATILKYGPTALGTLYGAISGAAHLSVPENLEELVANSPPGMSYSDAEGCAKGCSPVIVGACGGAIIGASTWLGYAIGHSMGK